MPNNIAAQKVSQWIIACQIKDTTLYLDNVEICRNGQKIHVLFGDTASLKDLGNGQLLLETVDFGTLSGIEKPTSTAPSVPNASESSNSTAADTQVSSGLTEITDQTQTTSTQATDSQGNDHIVMWIVCALIILIGVAGGVLALWYFKWRKTA